MISQIWATDAPERGGRAKSGAFGRAAGIGFLAANRDLESLCEGSMGNQIRVTGVLIEEGRLLLVRQKVTAKRRWSLPGGRVEAGESLEAAMIREMKEETGLDVAVERLLHITFALRRISGAIQLPTNEFDENPISDVRWVPVQELEDFGFSAKWREIVEAGFPGAPGYVGGKECHLTFANLIEVAERCNVIPWSTSRKVVQPWLEPKFTSPKISGTNWPGSPRHLGKSRAK